MKTALAIFLTGLSLSLFGQNDFGYNFSQGQKKYVERNFTGAVNDFNKALQYRKSVTSEYSIANVYNARALCKMELKNYKAALEDIAQALALKPEYSGLYYTRSLIHLENAQFDECISWVDKGLLLKPAYEELILLKAKAYISKKNYTEAISNLDTILVKINEMNLEALNLKGSAKQRLKDYKTSIEIFSRAIEIDAQNCAAFYDRGISKAYLKDFDGSIADINRGMEIDSLSKWVGYNNIAFFVKFDQKDYHGAIELFDKALKLNPNFAYAYGNRAYAKLKLNNIKGAKADISHAIDLNDKNAYAFKTYAMILLEEKENKLACEKLNKAIELGYTEEYDDEVLKLISENCKK